MKLFLGYLFIALSLSLAGQVYGLDIYWQQEARRQVSQKAAVQTMIAAKYSGTFTATVTQTRDTKFTKTITQTVTPTATPTK